MAGFLSWILCFRAPYPWVRLEVLLACVSATLDLKVTSKVPLCHLHYSVSQFRLSNVYLFERHSDQKKHKKKESFHLLLYFTNDNSEDKEPGTPCGSATWSPGSLGHPPLRPQGH